MESKIEKELLISIEELLIWFKRYERYVEGDSIDAVEWRGEFLEFIMYLVNNLEEQVNSQAQPEESNFVHTVGTPILESTTTCSQDTPEVFKEFSDKNIRDDIPEGFVEINGKLHKMEDTPEEWEKRYVKRFGYWGEEIKFIKQLLDEREKEVRKSVLKEVREWLFSYLDKLNKEEK